MKKTIVLTMLVLFIFAAGCGMAPGREIFLSAHENILGLHSVYYSKGRITFKFDDTYAKTDDDGYVDFIGLIRNGSRQDMDQVSVCIVAGDDIIFQEGKTDFDSTGLTLSANVGDVDKEITYLLIGYGDWKYGIDLRQPVYIERYSFTPVKVEKYGDHVYCPDYLFAEDEKANKRLVSTIRSQGRFQYTDIFVYDFQYFESDDSGTVYAHGYVNGAVVDALSYHANSNVVRGSPPGFFRDHNTYILPPEIDPDTSDLIDPEHYIMKLIMYIRQSENEYLSISNYPFSGTYILKYDVSSDYLYFEFVLNRGISLYVDAHTGEISDTLKK
ncbi:MAG: hypothetical protein J6128_05130 [Clostridia bacterium]|nr:hypothetical protein [Clostridia bacterium]